MSRTGGRKSIVILGETVRLTGALYQSDASMIKACVGRAVMAKRNSMKIGKRWSSNLAKMLQPRTSVVH